MRTFHESPLDFLSRLRSRLLIVLWFTLGLVGLVWVFIILQGAMLVCAGFEVCARNQSRVLALRLRLV